MEDLKRQLKVPTFSFNFQQHVTVLLLLFNFALQLYMMACDGFICVKNLIKTVTVWNSSNLGTHTCIKHLSCSKRPKCLSTEWLWAPFGSPSPPRWCSSVLADQDLTSFPHSFSSHLSHFLQSFSLLKTLASVCKSRWRPSWTCSLCEELRKSLQRIHKTSAHWASGKLSSAPLSQAQHPINLPTRMLEMSNSTHRKDKREARPGLNGMCQG